MACRQRGRCHIGPARGSCRRTGRAGSGPCVFLDAMMVRPSLRSGVGAPLPLCDERRFAVTSGCRRGTIGSASQRSRRAARQARCRSRVRDALVPPGLISRTVRFHRSRRQASHPRLVMPAKAGIALQLVRLQRNLRVEQELSSALGSRVTFLLRGQEKSNQKRRPPRLALAAHRATAPALPQLGHPCPRHGRQVREPGPGFSTGLLSGRKGVDIPVDSRCAACRPRLTAAQGPRLEQRAIGQPLLRCLNSGIHALAMARTRWRIARLKSQSKASRLKSLPHVRKARC
jgi:hypothetical protein